MPFAVNLGTACQLLGVFKGVGADLQLAMRLYNLVHQAGFHDVEYRTALLGVRSIDPMVDYLPSIVESLRGSAVKLALIKESDLDAALHDCRLHIRNYFLHGSPYRNTYGMGDIDPDTMKPGLQVEIIVDDPVTFNTPWSGFVTYRPVLGNWPEAICAENTQGSGSSWVVIVPRADKPDF